MGLLRAGVRNHTDDGEQTTIDTATRRWTGGMSPGAHGAHGAMVMEIQASTTETTTGETLREEQMIDLIGDNSSDA
jgi:hypothetical protein